MTTTTIRTSKNSISTPIENSNSRVFTRVFESKLFPHFSLFSSEATVVPSASSFIRNFRTQISKIENMISSGKFNSGYIVDVNGIKTNISKDDYCNVPDHVLDAIESHGVEHSIAYQVFRMIYTHKYEIIDSIINDFDTNTVEKVKISKILFNMEGFSPEKINPLARLHYKYAVFLEKETVKTALFAKVEELPKKYTVSINVPTPTILSEIYITTLEETNTIIFNIPDIFNNSDNYLSLPIALETKDSYTSIVDAFIVSQNVFLSMFKLNKDDTITLKFEGLGIANEFFLNRRAAITESHGGNSLSFYKIKLEEISISTVNRDEYSNKKSLSMTRKREKMELDMKNKTEEDDYQLLISRSKQVMHGIKNNRSSI